jgi:hypothetical protein
MGHLSEVTACDPQLNAVIACYHQHPETINASCTGGAPQCNEPNDALSQCITFNLVLSGTTNSAQ